LISRCPLRTIKANVIKAARLRLLVLLLLSLVRLDLWDHDRRRCKADDHEGQGQPAKHDPPGPQGHLVVGRRRMTRARQKQQHDHQAVADFALPDHVGDGQNQKQNGHPMGAATDQRVENVTAVQLSDRDQVEGSDENSDPARKQPGIVVSECVARGNRPFNQMDEPAEDHRLAVNRVGRIRVEGFEAGLVQADDRDRDGQHQTRQRPTDGNVEQAFPVCDPGSLNDHRSHRAER